jgi:type IX secretion system PorP/SprF family membrane protein
MMKKLILLLLLLQTIQQSIAQQMPFYTQHRSNNFMINPAVTGTKRLIDARLNYRMQWVGYEGAPRTTSIGLHSRFLDGKMGAGLYLMQDQSGPMKQTNLGASYAYHIRFPDCELSAGVAGNFTKFSLIGSRILLHNTQDPAIDQSITSKTWVTDGMAGVYLYNDRFHVGLSALHMLSSTAEFYEDDSTKQGSVIYTPHIYVTLGYNYSQNPDFIWENTLYANYVKAAPFNLDYTLRMHYQEQFFAGISIRLRDAIALQVGYTFLDDFQVSYSYDILVSKVKVYSSGTHEIMLIYSSDVFKNGRKGRGDKFLHQRYSYLF